MTESERTRYLRELVPLLWPAPATATLGRARHRNARRSYLILPSLAEPRLLLPRRPRRAAGAAVLGYGEQSSPARRAAVRAGALALAAGAGDLALRDRLEVGAGPTIEDELERDLGRDVLVSLHIGPPRANRKPVLQILDRRGRTVGFAKVATTPLAGQLVAAETATLRVLAAAGLKHLTAPRMLAGGSWNGL
ncbi:MAG TPA: aminoglycoside phosphotransferase, partial [Actinomycetota bacterium]